MRRRLRLGGRPRRLRGRIDGMLVFARGGRGVKCAVDERLSSAWLLVTLRRLKQIGLSSRTNNECFGASKLAMWILTVEHCYAANIQWLRAYT